jgi:hypothetical protein
MRATLSHKGRGEERKRTASGTRLILLEAIDEKFHAKNSTQKVSNFVAAQQHRGNIRQVSRCISSNAIGASLRLCQTPNGARWANNDPRHGLSGVVHVF